MSSPSKVHPHFWVPVSSHPELAARAEELAKEIVGKASSELHALELAGKASGNQEMLEFVRMASENLLARARDVAKAEIELRRVQQVCDELSRNLPASKLFAHLVAAAKLTPVKTPARSMILGVYDRERQATSRLRKANRAFNVALRRVADALRKEYRRVLRLKKSRQWVENMDAMYQSAWV
jgi:hypothetical protein